MKKHFFGDDQKFFIAASYGKIESTFIVIAINNNNNNNSLFILGKIKYNAKKNK